MAMAASGASFRKPINQSINQSIRFGIFQWSVCTVTLLTRATNAKVVSGSVC